MNISHLVVSGCSWAYCQGLENPKVNGWPAIVAKELGVPLVNIAKPGAGNDAIHRRTYEYTFEDLKNDNDPFYIICWTQPWRREAWCRHIYNKNAPKGYNPIIFPDSNKPTNHLEKGLLDTWSEEDFYRRLMLYRLSVDSLFKSKNINYISSFFSAEEYVREISAVEEVQNLKSRLHNGVNYLNNNSNRVTNFYEIGDLYPVLPCGHYGIEGNKAIADYVIKYFRDTYKHITPVNKKYLPLIVFNRKSDPYDGSLEWT